MERQNLPWTFSSHSEFQKELTSGRLLTAELSSIYQENIVRYSFETKEKDCPSSVSFNTSLNAPVYEAWYYISPTSGMFPHRENGPAIISAKGYTTLEEKVEYYYYGILHGGPFINGHKWFYGRIHGDTYSNWYYGLEVIPQERFRMSKDSKLLLSKDLTLTLCQPEEVEDMRNQFDQYATKKLSKTKPNKAPIHSVKELITWLRDIRADLNFTSDVAAAEMIKDAAMKVYHQVTDDELKVLKRWGSQVMFWYRGNVNRTDKKFLKKKMEIYNNNFGIFTLNKFPNELINEISTWLKVEGLGYAV